MIVFPSGEEFIVLHVSRQFDIADLRDKLRGEAVAEVPSAPHPIPDRAADDADFGLLVAAMTEISRTALDELGVFVAANALKETRKGLVRRRRCLTSMRVKKDGKIVMSGEPECSLAEAVEATADWMGLFLQRCNEIVPTFPHNLAISLLEHMRAELDEVGFFTTFRELGSEGR
jgi:hypothetical protein